MAIESFETKSFEKALHNAREQGRIEKEREMLLSSRDKIKIKTICCKCGSKMVCNDNHYVCEAYLEDIKKGVERQQEIIDELNREGEL